MTSMTDGRRRGRVVVDTHKHIHVAAALDEFGMLLEAQRFSADREGYTRYDSMLWMRDLREGAAYFPE